MAGLAHYMEQYDHEHHSGWNKLLHGIGIPLELHVIWMTVFLLFNRDNSSRWRSMISR